jgi:hypothetical protein
MHKLALCSYIVTSLYTTIHIRNDMNNINNKIPWGLAIGTLGVTVAGALNDTAVLGLASVTCGALALVTTLLARQQIEKKKLRPELAMGLK